MGSDKVAGGLDTAALFDGHGHYPNLRKVGEKIFSVNSQRNPGASQIRDSVRCHSLLYDEDAVY